MRTNKIYLDNTNLLRVNSSITITNIPHPYGNFIVPLPFYRKDALMPELITLLKIARGIDVVYTKLSVTQTHSEVLTAEYFSTFIGED